MVCGYVGYIAAVNVTYRYQQSHSFGSIGAVEGERFRAVTQALNQYELSRIVRKNDVDSIQRHITYLNKLRVKAPADISPIIDLGIATDHAVLVHLYEETHHKTQADENREQAQRLFRNLGWIDVSEKTLNDVAEKQLESRFAR